MDKVLLLLILILPMSANAQHVYKCVQGADVVYQSAPCAGTASIAKQWEAVPEPPADAAELQRRALVLQQGLRESAYLQSLAGTSQRPARRTRASGVSISAARDGKRCAEARRKRDAAESSLGLRRTYKSMQAAGDRVYEACR